MDDFNRNIVLFMSFSAVSYIILFSTLRRRFLSLLDPLHVGVVFVSLPMAIGGFLFEFNSIENIILYALIFLCALVFSIVISLNPIEISSEIQKSAKTLRDNSSTQIFTFIVCGSNYIINIYGSGFEIGGIIDKSAVSQNNRGLFLIALYFSPIIFGFLYLFQGTILGYLAGFTFFVAPLFNIFSGQKGAIATLVLGFFYINYLKKIDGIVGKGKYKYLEIFGGILVVLSIIFSSFLLIGSDAAAILIARLLIGFDQIAFVFVTNFPIQKYDLSLFQLQFSSILKLFRIFDSQYDSIGQFIAVEAMGYPPDFKGLLPNSNLIAEVVFTQGLYISAPIIVFISALHAKLYLYFFRNRYSSVLHFILFLTYINSPFDFLFNGGAFIVRIVVLTLIAAPFSIISDRASRRNSPAISKKVT